MKALRNLTIIMSIFVLSCDGTSGTEFKYEEARDRGIGQFEEGNFKRALNLFIEAETKTEESVAEINGWIGWAHFKLSNAQASLSAFDTSLSDQDTVIVDVLAGVSFVLNATGEYESSNDFVSDVRSETSNWVFDYGLNLTAEHLTVLAAQNHFNLGNFVSSLSEIRSIDGTFTADVNTAEGQAALAAKIEELSSN